MSSATLNRTHRRRPGPISDAERRDDRRVTIGVVPSQLDGARSERGAVPTIPRPVPFVVSGGVATDIPEPTSTRESRSFVRTLVSELDHRIARSLGDDPAAPARDARGRGTETVAERAMRVKALVANLRDHEVAEIRAELTQNGDHSAQTRLALAVTTPLMQESLERLATDAGMAVVAHANNEALLLRKVHSYAIDVVVVDLGPSSPRVARQIRAARPGIAVLVLADDAARARDLLEDRANGVGYLLKDENLSFDRILSAITLVAQGGTVVDPRVLNNLASNDDATSIGGLTAREREVLQLIAEGLGNQMIAERLVVTKRAIEKHVNNIFIKLNLPPGNDYDRRVLAARVFDLHAAA